MLLPKMKTMKTTLTRYSNIIKAGFLGLLILFTVTGISSASHIVGGEITYQWVSGNIYNVRLSLYRDCSGIPFSNTQTLEHSSVSCGFTGTFIVTQIGAPEQVSPICAASLANSSCNGTGGLLYGVEKYTYEGIDSLPGNCDDWQFSFSQCCRNAGVTNLVSASSSGSYFSAMLNNLNVPFNNSVSFGSIPYSIINNNATTQLSWNTFDVDGDSLIYELIPARDFNGTPFNLTYVSGYTYMEPFLASQPTTLNYANGLLEVSPNAQQVSVVCMKVSEYRNGIFIGEVTRDYQIVVVNSTNNPPALTGMNGSSNYVINGCPGDSIFFTVTGTDQNFPQYVSLSMNNPGTTATFISNSSIVATGIFSWVPTNADISASAYTFIITANDDNCDYYGTFSQAYYVYVNGCITDNVWPGDANSDGTANLYDLLAVGLAYNDSGITRPGANIYSWTPQPCSNWSNSFNSGINHKHADTNGDGIVNMSDTLAINVNYGLYHPLRNSNPNTTTVADLVVTSNVDTTDLSMPIDFDIALATPVDSIYGLAFRLYFDPSLVDLSTLNITYPGSMFGVNAVDMIKIDKSQGMNGFVDIALSRMDHVNISGSGPVAKVTIVTTDNVSGKVTINVAPFDIVAITKTEALVSLNGIGDGVVIDPNYLGIQESIPGELIQVYPTPANDVIHLNYTGSQKIDYITMYDVAGREVLQLLNPTATNSIDVKNISKGTYFIRVGIGENSVHKKILVF